MATYEEIKKANDETIKTPIKAGNKTKNYVEGNERIKAFRKVYPEGFIHNIMISNENGVCIFRSEVGTYDERGERKVLGTGTAYETEGATFINKTSYIENCETSACGRALGMAGFGIDEDVASANEVANSEAMTEEEKEKIRIKALNDLRNLYEKNGGKDWDKWLKEVAPDGMNNDIYKVEMTRLKKEITDKAEAKKGEKK